MGSAISATQVEQRRISTIELSSTLPAKQNSTLGSSLEQVLISSGLIFFQYDCLRSGSNNEYFIVARKFQKGRAV